MEPRYLLAMLLLPRLDEVLLELHANLGVNVALLGEKDVIVDTALLVNAPQRARAHADLTRAMGERVMGLREGNMMVKGGSALNELMMSSSSASS